MYSIFNFVTLELYKGAIFAITYAHDNKIALAKASIRLFGWQFRTTDCIATRVS